jgi:hypothetical protein
MTKLETLDTVAQDLDMARARIDATRAALQLVLDGRESAPVREMMERLGRMAAELERIEASVAGHAAITAR